MSPTIAFVLGMVIGCGLGVATMSMMIVSKWKTEESSAE